MDYIEFDCTPYDEECSQVGTSNYYLDSILESKAIINQLIRMFGEPPECTYFKKASCPHDFGTYYEIRLNYNEWNDYCIEVESRWPQLWDDEAITFLKQNNYSLPLKGEKVDGEF